uniref:Uncharacterized protein n=1 Tax=Lygus hesperus TaxID=30085 RepID=A0A146LP33_LYGHE
MFIKPLESKHCWLLNRVWCVISSVEILTSLVHTRVTTTYTVWVEHRYNIKNKMLPKLYRTCVAGKQERDKAMNGVRRSNLTRMYTTTNQYNLLTRAKVCIRTMHLMIVTGFATTTTTVSLYTTLLLFVDHSTTKATIVIATVVIVVTVATTSSCYCCCIVRI